MMPKEAKGHSHHQELMTTKGLPEAVSTAGHAFMSSHVR
jgi:hypothetical protein